ncbi:MAG: site-2 protease family protein [Candidatus Norongarragalinales archaeon]
MNHFERNKDFWIAVVALASAAAFFAIAFSTFNDWVKLAVSIVLLGVSGTILGKLSGQEHHFGFIIVRGVSGFKQMRHIAKHHAKLSKALSDFGLTLGFGVFYGWRLFSLSKKLLLHAFGMALFYALFLLQPTMVESQLIVIIGFAAGLFGIGFFFLAQHAYDILTVPATPPGVIPIVPGVTVPWEVVFALIIVVVVHELAHGVLCLVENLKVKSSGLLLFGILPVGAFVEPDEKKMAKMDKLLQLRILGAGSTSNALFFVLFLIVGLALSQITPLMVESVSVKSVFENSTVFSQLSVGEKVFEADGKLVKTAEDLRAHSSKGVLQLKTSQGDKLVRAFELEILSSSNPSLEKGERIYSAKGKPTYNLNDLRLAVASGKAGESVLLETSAGEKSVVLNEEGKLGVTLALRPTVEFENNPFDPFLFGLFSFVLLVVVFTFTLNFILATVNLLPLFLTDGQRIFLVELQDAFGKETGTKIALGLGLVSVGLLLINALPWFT